MNNSWNKFIYKCWSPIYDRIFNSGMFLKARRNVFNDIKLKHGSKILFVGVGTGADLPFFLNQGYEITAIDYSADMLKMAKQNYNDPAVTFLQMDALKLEFNNDTFDYIVASLILSVVPNPRMALKEIIRVLKSDGHFLIFDKFVPLNRKVSLVQKIIRPAIKLFGTDIAVDFYDISREIRDNFTVLTDEDVMMNGFYRKIVGTSKSSSS